MKLRACAVNEPFVAIYPCDTAACLCEMNRNSAGSARRIKDLVSSTEAEHALNELYFL